MHCGVSMQTFVDIATVNTAPQIILGAGNTEKEASPEARCVHACMAYFPQSLYFNFDIVI